MGTLYVREAMPQDDFGPTLSEKLERNGPDSLRDGELLIAVLDVKPEEARAILAAHPLQALARLSVPELSGVVGKARGRRFAAALETAKRALGKGTGVSPVISSPSDVVPLLADIASEKREHFVVLLLNARNQVLRKELVSLGSLSASIVHPREVFLPAVTSSAASIILCHNHPSGDVTPSRDDVDLTRRLVEAGRIMGIEVLDHIIVSDSDFLSLRERGLM